MIEISYIFVGRNVRIWKYFLKKQCTCLLFSYIPGVKACTSHTYELAAFRNDYREVCQLSCWVSGLYDSMLTIINKSKYIVSIVYRFGHAFFPFLHVLWLRSSNFFTDRSKSQDMIRDRIAFVTILPTFVVSFFFLKQSIVVRNPRGFSRTFFSHFSLKNTTKAWWRRCNVVERIQRRYRS